MRDLLLKILVLVLTISNMSFIPTTLSDQQQTLVESKLQKSINNLEIYKNAYIYKPNYVNSTNAIPPNHDATFGAYIQANWANGENVLGKDKSLFYDQLVQDQPEWINTLNLNFITSFSLFSVPVKGSSLSMNFELSYNSQSYIDTGVGYGWVHNYCHRVLIDGSGDLLMRTSSGSIVRFKKVEGLTNVWDSPYGSHLKAGFYTENDVPYIKIVQADGSGIIFYQLLNDFVPLKYFDCQGKFFYIEYDAFGKIDNIKNDYATRYLHFEYDSTGRLFKVYDYTTNPTVLRIQYLNQAGGYVLQKLFIDDNSIMPNMGEFEYSDFGEMTRTRHTGLSYDLNVHGRVYGAGRNVPTEAGNEVMASWTYLLPHPGEITCNNCYTNFTTRTFKLNGDISPRRIICFRNDNNGNLIDVLECVGQSSSCQTRSIISMSYNSKGDISNTKKKGETLGTSYTYDYEVSGSTNTGQVVRIEGESKDVNVIPRPTIEYSYDDECGCLTSSTDTEGSTTNYEYYGDKKFRSVTNPNNETKSVEYDSYGQLSKVNSTTCDGTTDSTTIGYDTQGRVTSITADNGESINYSYNLKDKLETVSGIEQNVLIYGRLSISLNN